MPLFDDIKDSSDRYGDVQKLKKAKKRREKLRSKKLTSTLAKAEGQPINVEKNFDPEADRSVITNRNQTWSVEMPTEHIGNEHDGALCGRTRDGGNIYTTPGKATCRRCISAYKRARKKNKKIPPIKPNVQPRLESFQPVSFAPRVVDTNLTVLNSAICLWLLGYPTLTKIKGSREQLRVLTNALTATKSFLQELQNPRADFNEVVRKLAIKTTCAQKFENMFGFAWPV